MKTITLLLLMIFVPLLIFSQVTFLKTFTITGDDDGLTVTQTRDGNYLVYGISNSFAGHSNVFLLKTDANGDSLWSKKFYGINEYNLNHEPLIETTDTGYLFTSISTISLDTNLLTKTNKNGDILWTVNYDKVSFETMLPTDDGGYLLCGFDTSRKICLIKTTHDGYEQWRKWISHAFYFNVFVYMNVPTELSIRQTTDRGFIISGNSTVMLVDPPITRINYTFLIKTDSTGDTLWSKKIHDFPIQDINSIQSIPGNGFEVAGVQDSLTNNGPRNMNGFIRRFDENGDSLWTKYYGGPGNQGFNSLEKTGDGGFIACGENNPDLTNPPPFGFYGLYLVRMNAAGDTLWTKYYPGGQAGDHDIIGRSIHQTTDGGFIACGVKYDSSDHGHVFLIKTDGLGNVYPQGTDDKKPIVSLSPFPNPTSGMVYLNPPGQFTTLEISDLIGNIILRKNIDPGNNSTLKIDLSGKPSGVYLVKVKNESSTSIGKIVLAK